MYPLDTDSTPKKKTNACNRSATENTGRIGVHIGTKAPKKHTKPISGDFRSFSISVSPFFFDTLQTFDPPLLPCCPPTKPKSCYAHLCYTCVFCSDPNSLKKLILPHLFKKTQGATEHRSSTSLIEVRTQNRSGHCKKQWPEHYAFSSHVLFYLV